MSCMHVSVVLCVLTLFCVYACVHVFFMSPTIVVGGHIVFAQSVGWSVGWLVDLLVGLRQL
jgi:hypothetical protein